MRGNARAHVRECSMCACAQCLGWPSSSSRSWRSAAAQKRCSGQWTCTRSTKCILRLSSSTAPWPTLAYLGLPWPTLAYLGLTGHRSPDRRRARASEVGAWASRGWTSSSTTGWTGKARSTWPRGTSPSWTPGNAHSRTLRRCDPSSDASCWISLSEVLGLLAKPPGCQGVQEHLAESCPHDSLPNRVP